MVIYKWCVHEYSSAQEQHSIHISSVRFLYQRPKNEVNKNYDQNNRQHDVDLYVTDEIENNFTPLVPNRLEDFEMFAIPYTVVGHLSASTEAQSIRS